MTRVESAIRPAFEEEPYLLTINISNLQPLVALIAGILILIAPRLLNFIVAIFLIIFGVLGLWPNLVQ
jgi:hypothetical protein